MHICRHIHKCKLVCDIDPLIWFHLMAEIGYGLVVEEWWHYMSDVMGCFFVFRGVFLSETHAFSVIVEGSVAIRINFVPA